jgi:Holliday junction DNA helicase RuvA
MIASLNGRILETGVDFLVVEVGGVGLQVFVPAELKQKSRAGEAVFLFTQLIVREESLTLFGFESRDGREFFNLLLTVNGVGPKLALATLNVLSPDAIRRAVFHEQAEVFARVPGVGRKTAQKILLQLQDKVSMEAGLERVAAMSDLDTEVIAALTSLGYSVVEAQAALQTIPRDAPADIETRLRMALGYFST